MPLLHLGSVSVAIVQVNRVLLVPVSRRRHGRALGDGRPSSVLLEGSRLLRPVSLRCPALFARVDEDRSVAADLRVLGTEPQGYVATRGASSDGRALPGVGDGGDLRGGSSPRWRGVQARAGYCGRRRRIIPGCAGPARSCRPTRCSSTDHPRLRGACFQHSDVLTTDAGPSPSVRGVRLPSTPWLIVKGPSPAVRGLRFGPAYPSFSHRTIPGCAGQLQVLGT